MLETLMYLALGIAYVAARDAEKKEEERAKKEAEELQKKLEEIDRQTELKIKLFNYAWYHNIPWQEMDESKLSDD